MTGGGSARGGTILLVEDEEDIATLVRTYLEKDGFRVIWATRGIEGLLALEQNDIRLAILDLQLPDADGLDLCRAIRSSSRLPIVIVTARDEEIDRITGLELGADDYVTKPFSPRELVARVRAVLRRAEPEEDEDLVAFGDLVLEHAGRTVSVGGNEVELTGMEFDLLAFLLAHPGIVMSRERLLERVWGLSFPGGTRTVDVHVAQLRQEARSARSDQDRAGLRVQGGRVSRLHGPRSLRGRLFVGIAATLAVVDGRDARGRSGTHASLARPRLAERARPAGRADRRPARGEPAAVRREPRSAASSPPSRSAWRS